MSRTIDSRLPIPVWLIAVLLSPAWGLAQSWLMSLPEIASDEKRVYFSNDAWTGYYSVNLKVMLTLPRDSVNPPPPAQTAKICSYGDYDYVCGSGKLTRKFMSQDSVIAFEPPSNEAMKNLRRAAGDRADAISVPTESCGPICSGAGRIWFGLALSDTGAKATTGGIGWYDPANDVVVRTYPSILNGLKPSWVGVAGDTAYALFTRMRKGKPAATVLLGVAPSTADVFEVDIINNNIPGKVILSMSTWNEKLLIATDAGIAIWKIGEQPSAWSTRACTTRDPVLLYLCKFSSPLDTTGFLPFLPGRLSNISAEVGDFYQIAAPQGIEAYVDELLWQSDSAKVSGAEWGCVKPCYARVKIPTKGTFLEGDFWNTPITYLGRDSLGVKIGIQAAWIPKSSVVPVLVPAN